MMGPAPRIGVALLVLLASGCLGKGTTQPTRFFTLHALDSASAPVPTDAARQIVIGVGPTRFPQYLRRPNLVTLRTPGEYRVADFSRWGEPLANNFERTLAENLEGMVGGSHVLLFPWRSTVPVDYQVSMDVLRFDSGPDDRARLRVNWIVLGGEKKRPLLMRQSEIETQIQGKGDDDIVEGMSRAVAEFGRDVAQVISDLPRSPRENAAGGRTGAERSP